MVYHRAKAAENADVFQEAVRNLSDVREPCMQLARRVDEFLPLLPDVTHHIDALLVKFPA